MPHAFLWAWPISPRLCLSTAARVCPGAQDPPVQKREPVTNSSHVKKPGCEKRQVTSQIFYTFSLSLHKRSSTGWVLQNEGTVWFSGQRPPRHPMVCDRCQQAGCENPGLFPLSSFKALRSCCRKNTRLFLVRSDHSHTLRWDTELLQSCASLDVR